MKVSRKEFKYILLITVFGYVVCSLSYFTSFEYITVGLSTMLLYTHPALVVIFVAIIYKEKLSIKKIASISITTLGIYLLVDFKGTEFSLYGIVLAMLTFVEGAKIVGSPRAAIISTFEPVFSLVLAVILFNEAVTASLVVGSTLIIISIIIYSANN